MESGTTYKDMIMFKTMARLAKRNPVRWLVSQFWIRGERLDVVRVQFDGVTVSAMLPAVLAGIVVALKNGATPELVFCLVTSYAVLMGLVNMTSPLGYLCSFCLFGSYRMGQLCASLRAHFSEHPALAVFWHRLGTDRARYRLFHTFGAHLVSPAKIVRAPSAHLAGYADASGIGLQSSCARHTSGILDGLPQSGYGWGRFAAFATRNKSGSVARITNAIVSAIHLTLDAPILCHTAIIPQLPDLEKSR